MMPIRKSQEIWRCTWWPKWSYLVAKFLTDASGAFCWLEFPTNACGATWWLNLLDILNLPPTHGDRFACGNFSFFLRGWLDWPERTNWMGEKGESKSCVLFVNGTFFNNLFIFKRPRCWTWLISTWQRCAGSPLVNQHFMNERESIMPHIWLKKWRFPLDRASGVTKNRGCGAGGDLEWFGGQLMNWIDPNKVIIGSWWECDDIIDWWVGCLILKIQCPMLVRTHPRGLSISWRARQSVSSPRLTILKRCKNSMGCKRVYQVGSIRHDWMTRWWVFYKIVSKDPWPPTQ